MTDPLLIPAFPEWQDCYDANMAVAEGVLYLNVAAAGSGAIPEPLWELFRSRLSAMGNANSAAGLHVPPKPEAPTEVFWSNTKSGDSFAVVFTKSSDGGNSNVTILARHGGGGLQTFYQGGVLHDLTLDRVTIRVEKPVTGSKWGVRAFNLSGQWTDLVVKGMGQILRDSDGKVVYINEGHAVYVNPVGTFELIRAQMVGNTGQGYQEATRAHLNNGTVTPRVGLTRLAQCEMIENGYYVDPMGGPTISGGDRSSDPVTINGGGEGHDVVIEDLTVTCEECPDFKYSAGVANSRGAVKLLADSWTDYREYLAWGNGVTEDHGEPPWKSAGYAFRSVLMTGTNTHIRGSDRAAFFLRGAKDAELRDGYWEDSVRPIKIELDPEGNLCPKTKDGTKLLPSQRILWTGHNGEGVLRYRGNTIGPLEGTYEFKDGRQV